MIGGKSMGGRLASMVAADVERKKTPVRGVVCLGYPFHAPGRTDVIRKDHLMALQTPTLIVQGARDTFDWYDEVVDYGLPAAVVLEWMEDGDHDFKPRAASGRTMRQNWDAGIAAAAAFVKSL